MLTTSLERSGEFKVVGSAGTGEQGWELCTRLAPDVLLLDIGLAGGDGLMLAERLKTTSPQIKLIVVSGRADPYMLHRLHQLALPGYVSKASELATLREAILSVAQGNTYYTEPFTHHLEAQDAFFRVLTGREVEVLFATTQGQTKADAGKDLHITVSTLHKHLSNIRRKLGLHRHTELLRYATRIGMDL